MSHELAKRLRFLLGYDPNTGVFRWAHPQSNRCSVGNIAGNINQRGYRRIAFDGQTYLAHRLAWFYVHGRWPVDRIDHIDGDCANNAIANLREATATENNWNNSSRGYHYSTRYKKFKTAIQVRGVRVSLGSFDSADEARSAYLAATVRYFGEFSVVHSRLSSATGAINYPAEIRSAARRTLPHTARPAPAIHTAEIPFMNSGVMT